MKLHRPHVPLGIRVQVAERQVRERGGVPFLARATLKYRLTWSLTLLSHLGLVGKLELHHRPALVNRQRNSDGSYIPAANDPNFLFYVPKHEHDIETRVRGLGAQRSDLGQRRYNKRVKRNRDPKRKKFKWPKGRKFRSRPWVK